MSDQVTATVRVEFVMEYESGPWGLDCNLAQVVKQSQDGARLQAGRIVENSQHLLRVIKIGPPSIHMPEEEPQ